MMRSLMQFLCFAFLMINDTGLEATEAWGTLRGRFLFDGVPPQPKQLEVNVDVEAFQEPIDDESLIVQQDNRAIANVVIYLLVARGQSLAVHPSYAREARSRISFDLVKGRFSPHILLVRTTQTVVQKSSDRVLHNAHIQVLANTPVSMMRPPGKPIEHSFPDEEFAPLPVRCNIHPWESAYILVRANPYMAKTDSNGRFEIKHIPAGDHVFRFWHERVGYLRHVRLGSDTLDSKGRLSVQILSGSNRLPDAHVPASMFESTQP